MAKRRERTDEEICGDLLPGTSRAMYEKEWAPLEVWVMSKEYPSIKTTLPTEKLLLESSIYKTRELAATTLLSKYSMLNAQMKLNHSKDLKLVAPKLSNLFRIPTEPLWQAEAPRSFHRPSRLPEGIRQYFSPVHKYGPQMAWMSIGLGLNPSELSRRVFWILWIPHPTNQDE